jgi:hypothetical protein
MNSASLCSLAGRYDNPIPPRFLAPIAFLKIPALDCIKLENCTADLFDLCSYSTMYFYYLQETDVRGALTADGHTLNQIAVLTARKVRVR